MTTEKWIAYGVCPICEGHGPLAENGRIGLHLNCNNPEYEVCGESYKAFPTKLHRVCISELALKSYVTACNVIGAKERAKLMQEWFDEEDYWNKYQMELRHPFICVDWIHGLEEGMWLVEKHH